MKSIVKIQLSIVTSAQVRQMMIYNEDRSILVNCDANKEVIRLMRGRLKAYFNASLVNGQLEILDEVPEQVW